MSFPERLAEAGSVIGRHLQVAVAALPDSRVRAAMDYALAGGKRLRGYLVLESAQLHGVARADALDAAAAIEAIHAYSLVHDDLPCMDDDDLRRGQPTVHVKWDEATAVLAGDALQSLAFALVAGSGTLAPTARLALVATLAQAAGAQGMVLGQAQDIAAETASEPLSLEQITALQQAKTGALIVWAACAGPRMVGGDIAPLSAYAQALGLAFQIADDILDVKGVPELMGKRLRKDAAAGKATFVSHLGLTGADARARALVAQAEAALEPYGEAARGLREAARFVIARES